MSKTTVERFEDFLAEQEVDDTEGFKTKQSWLKALQEFYDLILTYVKPFIEYEKMSVHWDTVTLNEEENIWFWEYEARQLTLNIGPENLVFEPIGRFVVGAEGRVDLKMTDAITNYVYLTKTFVVKQENEDSVKDCLLNSSTTKWYWKITDFYPNLSYQDLTEQSFFDLLKEIPGVKLGFLLASLGSV